MIYKHGADVAQIQEQYGNKELLDFSSNVNIFMPSQAIALLSGISENELSTYPDSMYSKLREKLATKYALSPQQVIVGNGSTEIIFLLARLPQLQRIGIINPTFGEYRRAAKLFGKEVIDFFYEPDFSIDVAKMDLDGVDALFVCNPNNPSGNINDLAPLLQKARKTGTLLIVDETFIDFTSPKQSLIGELSDEHLFIIKAVTKFYALTSVRLGYGFADRKWIEQLWAIKEPWTVNLFAQKMVDVIFDEAFEKKSTDFYIREIDWMKKSLESLGMLQVYPSNANFLLIRLPHPIRASQLKEKLIVRHGILIRDCSNYIGLDEYHIRVNIKEREKNQHFIEALREELFQWQEK